jgi:glycosyltransferase involved in cell wall biosynthesis
MDRISLRMIITLIAALTGIYLVYTLVEFLIGFKSIKNLKEQQILPTAKLPTISIIFSALNEENEIEAAVMSLLHIDYPHVEIIAINDRSNDNTAEILNSLKKRYSQLTVLHIEQLPTGWFGKNHALYYGSQHATSDWLLFTDADVIMKPETLSRAISYAIEHDCQHLTICENHVQSTFWLKILLLAHYLTYSISFKPWRIRYRWSKRSLGHGAFNLVNKITYDSCGSHQAIALECLDDLKLGALIKSQGFKQDTVDGRDFVQRKWYQSLPDMIEGWKKNTFAYFEYKLLPLTCSSIFAVVFLIWAVICIMVFYGLLQWISIVDVCLMLLISTHVCKHFRMPIHYAIFYPLAIIILLYAVWNSVFAIYRQNGVVWRGTHYPLDTLRANK